VLKKFDKCLDGKLNVNVVRSKIRIHLGFCSGLAAYSKQKTPSEQGEKMSDFYAGRIDSAIHIANLVQDGYTPSQIIKTAMEVVVQAGAGGEELVKTAQVNGLDYASGMKSAFLTYMEKVAEAEGEFETYNEHHVNAVALSLLGQQLEFEALQKEADEKAPILARAQGHLDNAVAFHDANRAVGYGDHGGRISDALRAAGGSIGDAAKATAGGAIRLVRGGPDAGYARQAAGVAVPLAAIGGAGYLASRYMSDDDDKKKRASLEGIGNQAQLAALFGY